MEHAVEVDRKADRETHAAMRGAEPPAMNPVLEMQQLAGNQAVQAWLRGRGIHPKLAIGSADDPEEREADAVADRITRSPAAHSSRASCSCTEGEKKCAASRQKPVSIQRQATRQTAPQPHAPDSVRKTLGAAGHPLDSRDRAFFESSFGKDFRAVRLHTDSQAAESARAVNALAYTSGRDIVFGAGQFAPESASGRRLLAHELTHVVQQSGAEQVSAENNQEGVVRRQPVTPLGAGGGFGGLMDRDRQKASQPGTPPDPKAQAGPTISQGPIGEVVIGVRDWEFFDPRSITKDWGWKSDDVTFATVPIPDLAVAVAIQGSASAHAGFVASVGPGALRNIRVGITRKQYTELLVGAGLLGGLLGPGALLGGAAGASALGLRSFRILDSFRALADLDVGAHLSVSLGAEGQIHAAAKALGLFKVATLGAGLSVNAGGSVDIRFGGPIGVYYEDGHMTFRFNQSLEAQLRLFFTLVATLEASLLGFRWKKAWPVIAKDIGTVWAVNAQLGVQYDDDANVTMPLGEGTLSTLALIQQLFTEAPGGLESLVPEAPPPQAGGPGGSGGPPSGPSGPGGPGGPTAPRGRTGQDPIPMTWFKSPGVYPFQIILGTERYVFTQPEFIPVPDGPNLSDVRRDAIDGQIEIGVTPGSDFYPAVNRVWPRVRAGVLRTGRKQANFRRLLEAHGFNWGSYEADHVRDLQWAGQDDYANLWPLERAHNNAANQILDQDVTYLDDTGTVVSVPLRNTPLGRYFRIARYG